MTKKIMPSSQELQVNSRKTEFSSLVNSELQKALGSTQQTSASLDLAVRRLKALEDRLMPSQRAFVLDPSKRKGAICTRRAGKTFGIRHLAADGVLKYPWADRVKAQPVIQYITQTRQNAVDLFWTPFRMLCEEIGLDAHWDDHQLRAQFANGTLVRAGGISDRQEIEKYRGSAYAMVLIDEPQSIGAALLEDLITQSISPALMDYDGTIAMTGTPGFAQAGKFYEIYCGTAPGWTKHGWSYFSNTYIPAHMRTVEYIEANFGPVSSPKIRREFFGEWVVDDSELVYQFNPSRNLFEGELPEGHDWRYLMGLDVGYRDPCAFVVGAYSRTHPDLFIVHAEQHKHMLPMQIEAKVRSLMEKYPTRRIMMDTGGSMAKNNMEEWIRRYAFPMQAADKTKKYDYIEHMNNQFARGRIKVARHLTELQQEWKLLVWDVSESEKDSVRHDNKPREHAGFNNHLSDAALYMWRESLDYRSKSPVAKPVPGTVGFLEERSKNAKLEAIRNLRNPKFQYHKLFR